MKINSVYIFFQINIPYLTEHFIGAIETKFSLTQVKLLIYRMAYSLKNFRSVACSSSPAYKYDNLYLKLNTAPV